MTETLSRENGLLSGYQTVAATLEGPAEWKAIRDRGLAEFKRLGVPTTRHEEWKYLSLRALGEQSFAGAYPLNLYREDLEGSPLSDLNATTLTFVNGFYAPELSSEYAEQGGAFVGTLVQGAEAFPEIVTEHLGQLAGNFEGKLGEFLDAPFVALNDAHLGEGAFVFVPKGIAAKTTIHLRFITKTLGRALAAYPRVLIVLERGAKAQIVESYIGLGGEAFVDSVSEVYLAEEAKLDHVRLQEESGETIHISRTQFVQEGTSRLHSVNVSFGAKIARNDVDLDLRGEYTESRLDGVYVGLGDQAIDNHTRIDHAKPNCNSFEVYKGILDGNATGVFNGKIFVYEDAQKTDAKQTNKALLLSPNASLNTKPQLEIFADDVKCTHGATVGQIREDALFYLRSRGVPVNEAKALLVYAFAAEVLERIEIPGVREALERGLFARLGHSGDPAAS